MTVFLLLYPVEGRSPVIFTPLEQGLQTWQLTQCLTQQRPEEKMEMAESSSRHGLASRLLCDFVSWRLTSIYEGTVTAAPLSSFCASIIPIGNQTMPLEHQGFVLLYLLRQELNSSSSCLWLPQWVLPALWTNELVMAMSTKVTSAITTQNSHERLHDCSTVALIRMQ